MAKNQRLPKQKTAKKRLNAMLLLRQELKAQKITKACANFL